MSEKKLSYPVALFQLLFTSVLGITAFFVPVEIGGRSTILFDHAARFVQTEFRTFALIAVVLMMLYGVVAPLISGKWKSSLSDKIIFLFKVFGLVLAVMHLTGTAPEAWKAKDKLPFLFDTLSLGLAMVIPIGALVLAFLIGFGLMQMLGSIFEPVMRRLWKTPGYSAIDAVASFVGSYSVGLLLTDQMYKSGKYNAREAAIIATGFSTVSAAFMVVVARTLNLMESWNFYFWSSFVITFAITAISARIPPITWINNKGGEPEVYVPFSNRIQQALKNGVEESQKVTKPWAVVWEHFWAGVRMTSAILPAIMGIGLTGLLLAEHTPVFDLIGYLLYPFTLLSGLDQPLIAAKAMASGLAEMFLPAILMKGIEADVLLRYVIAVTSVSGVVFFSGLVPCVLATEIPLKISHMLIIWLQRTIIGIVLASLIGRLGMAMGWLA